MSRSMTAAQFQALCARSLADITPERIAALKEKPGGPKSASPAQRARGLAPHDRASMNKTERRYAEYLEQERLAGRIIKWRFQAISFRLADRTHHCPDFLVMLNGGWQEIHEIKGWNKKRAAPVWTEIGWMRFKMGREYFDEYRWRLICLVDGEWKEWQPKD